MIGLVSVLRVSLARSVHLFGLLRRGLTFCAGPTETTRSVAAARRTASMEALGRTLPPTSTPGREIPERTYRNSRGEGRSRSSERLRLLETRRSLPDFARQEFRRKAAGWHACTRRGPCRLKTLWATIPTGPSNPPAPGPARTEPSPRERRRRSVRGGRFWKPG